jgi:hypothetical protein
MNSDDEVVARFYYNKLVQHHRFTNYTAYKQCKSMFNCSPEFWEELTGIPNIVVGARLTIADDRVFNDWIMKLLNMVPTGNYTAVESPNGLGYFRAISDDGILQSLHVEWVESLKSDSVL